MLGDALIGAAHAAKAKQWRASEKLQEEDTRDETTRHHLRNA